MNKSIIINEKDNVGIALSDLKIGEMHFGIMLKNNIPKMHKFALTQIEKGEQVIKYGSPIGIAKSFIEAGEHIHTHNLETALTETENYTFQKAFSYTPQKTDITFNGYLRGDGRVGIRNKIFVIPTVGCANKTAEKIAKKANELLALSEDIVCAFPHPYGCSQLGDDADNTSKCIAALCKHPNAGGALLISLGCENNNLENMSGFLGDYDTQRIKTLNMQECENEIDNGIEAVKEIYEHIKTDQRTKQPIEKLTIGFKCGGSDGFSGITANPLCGKLCDRLTNAGAGVILTEVPEMFGAEKILMERCINEDIFKSSVEMINGFKKYFTDYGQVVYENPSPGNKAGGITTLEEKSLGCITKGGFSAVTDILGLYEQHNKSGLSLLWGPGNDIVSTTNLTCAGAVMILFTTGRGTPLGAPVPTLKLSTNTELSSNKNKWIDFDCGTLLRGKAFDDAEQDLFDLVIETANGKKALNEINGYEEIAIFKNGVTL